MNKNIKMHQPEGPAFAPGETWVGANGNRVSIISTKRWGSDKYDVEVTYRQIDGSIASKDAGIFQNKYTHEADLVAANIQQRARPRP